MRLINQKQILLSACTFSEKAPQIDMRIKDIIVIAQNTIGKQAHIQPQLKGADLIFLSTGLDFFPAVMLLCRHQFKNRIVDPVKMSLCIRTGVRIAFRFFHKADFIPCRQHHRLKMQSALPQKVERTIRDCPGNRLRCQIKNPIRLSFPDCLDCRKHRRNRLTRPGRCFDKQFSAVADRMINMRDQLFLSLPVRERKRQAVNGILTKFLPGNVCI